MIAIIVGALVVAFASAGLNGIVLAQNGQPERRRGPKWWPSEWGPDDQRGAANRLTPAKVLEGSRLIREGKVYSLGRVYEHGMPLPGKRHFSLTIPGRPTGGPEGKNRQVYNE